MNLREARCHFSELLALLIYWMQDQDMHFALDEGMNHQGQGHMANSLHYSGCAQDILLYDKNGNYLTDEESYRPMGEKWKSLNEYCRWGGDFPGDANHVSFSPPELFGDRA
jgi:hypothetical protein